jgi:hypothetical protein
MSKSQGGWRRKVKMQNFGDERQWRATTWKRDKVPQFLRYDGA